MKFEKEVTEILQRLIQLPSVDATASDVLCDIEAVIEIDREALLSSMRDADAARAATTALAHIAALCCLGAEYIRQSSHNKTKRPSNAK